MFLKFWNAFAVSNDLQQILITDEIKSKTQCIENVTFFKEASGNRMSVSQTINLTSHYKPFEKEEFHRQIMLHNEEGNYKHNRSKKVFP